jgi:N-acetylmuramoyl-L-alanine amidase
MNRANKRQIAESLWQTLRRQLQLTAFLAVLSVIFYGTAIAEPQVKNIRAGQHPDKIRLVLDLSAAVPFETFTLANPYRIVVDLGQVTWPKIAKKMLPVDSISGFRFGLFKVGTSRLVVDTKTPLMVSKTMMLPPSPSTPLHRLVIDLTPVSRQTYLAQSKAAQQKRLSKMAGPQVAIVPKQQVLTPKSVPADRVKTIIIDPGHGGVDPGAIGVSGVHEKTIVLAMAHELKAVLERSGRYRVHLTRHRDVFLRLRQRFAVARAAGGDLFISIHADSLADRRHRGASVYTLSERASDKEAAQLAAQENKSDIIAGMDFTEETPEVANILIDLAQRETMNHAARFAGTLVKELGRDIKTQRRSHRFAGFAVLKAPDIPSVLVELGYLSNRTDEKLLQNQSHRQKIAKAIQRGIDAFFGIKTRVARN